MLEMLSAFTVFNLVTRHLLPLFAPTQYIDPNTGGMLFQLLAVLFGVISGILLIFSGRVKNLYYKIRRRLGGVNPAASQKEEPEEPLQEKE